MAPKPLLSVRRTGVTADPQAPSARDDRVHHREHTREHTRDTPPTGVQPGASSAGTPLGPAHLGTSPLATSQLGTATASEPLATHLRPRRSPRLVAAGVLLACLGGLGASVAYQQASHANQVVIVQHTVMRGATVGPQDLGVATIGPAPGVHTIPAGQLDALVGKQALVDLPAGSLVGPDAVGAASLPAGAAQLGLKLPAGRIPNQPLWAGTPVQLVEVSSDKQVSGSLVVDATVVSAPEKLADGSSRVVDVAVPQAQAQRVADLAARDLLVVVRRAGA